MGGQSRRGGGSGDVAKQQPFGTQSTQSGIQRFFRTTSACAASNLLTVSGAAIGAAAPSQAQPECLPDANLLEKITSNSVGEGHEKTPDSRTLKDFQEPRHDKRMRISPGTLIQQSQDDGGDQVVWRVSPTAERLQGATTVERAPVSKPTKSGAKGSKTRNMRDFLSKAYSRNPPTLDALQQKKKSPGLAGKLEEWLSTAEAPKQELHEAIFGVGAASEDIILFRQNCSNHRHQTPSNAKACSKADKENEAPASIGSGIDSAVSQRSHRCHPIFSLHRCSLVPKSQKKHGATKSRACRRRKALLELLDQVQNVISLSDSSGNVSECSVPHKKQQILGIYKPSSVRERKTASFKPNFEMMDDSLSETMDTSIAVLPKKTNNCMEEDSWEGNTKLHCNTDSNVSSVKLDMLNAKLMNVMSNACNPDPFKLTVTRDAHMPTAVNDVVIFEPTTDTSMDFTAIVPKVLSDIHFLVLEVADVTIKGKESAPRKVLRLLNEHTGVERVLYLADEWVFTVVRPGDTVNVIGEFDIDGSCTIDREKNLLIVHPDILISGSKVGSSFSCPRRAVFDERVRSTSVAFAALLGTMMHELFQFGLVENVISKEQLEQEANSILLRNIDCLYACGGNERETLDKLKECIPTIVNWLQIFLHASPSALPSVDFGSREGQMPISVQKVVDIEEMIYSPKFGLKGMIDASLLVSFGVKDQVLPLELKTGKGTTGQVALEHRAQVILYSLLMSDRYSENIESGLLYYLHTNQTQGVSVQHRDLVGLIMRRNEHASNISAAVSMGQYPSMLQSLHTCERCWHLNTCSIYHKVLEGGTSESSGLGKLFDAQTEHLTHSHLEFLKFWDHLIDLEAQDLQASQREIWRLPSKEREEAGRCLSGMRLSSYCADINGGQKSGSVFRYSFCRDITYRTVNSAKSAPFPALNERPFFCGDHVLLSTEDGCVAVAAGFICDISEASVSIRLSHQLRLPQRNGLPEREHLLQQVWRIDKDDTASFLGTMRFNLLQLFLRNGGYEHGRSLIVDLQPPRFDGGGFFSQDPAASYVRSAPDLNDDQRRAIFKVLSARDYTLILGMPGTGKTSTIVHAVKALLTRGASILLTSYTNSAVDNILLKLKLQGVDFIRLGRESAIHPELQDHVIEGFGVTTVDQVKQRMSEVHVMAVTCLGISHPLLTNQKFDVCIVDEAGQITLPVCLGPLRFAETFVLVGDHYQLPPLVRNPEAREKGLMVSLFRRLSEAHPHSVAALQCQYRMCMGIMNICNALIYGNRLRCGSLEVANAQLRIMDSTFQPSWLRKIMDPSRSVVFLNTDLLYTREAQRRSTLQNVTEASLVLMIIKAFRDGGVDEKDIGVISPYNYQVQLIRRLSAAEGLDTLEVHTIDRFQGRDKDCIMVSFVKCARETKSTGTLLADWHRINVAITRAKKKLVLIGSLQKLYATPILKLLIKQVEQCGGLLHVPQNYIVGGGLVTCNESDKLRIGF